MDAKGDFAPTYSSTNKAGPRFKTPISPVQKQLNRIVQDKGRPTDLFLDSKGDFVPVFNRFNRPSKNIEKSRLWILHKDGITSRSPLRDSDDGYTNYMPAVKLDDYYARLIKDTNILGIRNDGISSNLFGNNSQPIVVREIGKRWGVNKFKIPFEVSKGTQKAVDAVADATEAIYGRHPATYLDRYQADITRLSPFLIGNYLAKQLVFQRRNPFKWPTSVQYSLKSLKVKSDLKNELSKMATDDSYLLNPRGYNPLSIFSTPGVIMLNRNRQFLDPKAIARQVGNAAKTVATVGIAAKISLMAIKGAMPVAGAVIESILPIGGAIAGMLGRLSNPAAKWQPFAGMGRADWSPDFPKWQNPFSDWSIKGVTQGLALKGLPSDHLLVAGTRFIGSTLDAGVKWAQGAGDWAREKAKNFNEHIGKFGKGSLQDIDLTAFNNVGVDYVNLIPYASTQYEGQEYDVLDTIPFKFHDIRHDAPIVFRAILSGITDTFSPEYTSERYVGRPDKVHVYQGTDREIAFTFDVYPKSDVELITLWSKLSSLAGLTYPHLSKPGPDGGRGMISPYTRLTIGHMYNEAPGFISSLTYTVMDEGTWETTFAKVPKYIQVNVSFTYIGGRQMHSTNKMFDLPWKEEISYSTRLKSPMGEVLNLLKTGDVSGGRIQSFSNLASGGTLIGSGKGVAGMAKEGKKILGALGL